MVQGPEGSAAVAASLYNGSIDIFNPSLKKIGKIKVDEDPLKQCVFVPS